MNQTSDRWPPPSCLRTYTTLVSGRRLTALAVKRNRLDIPPVLTPTEREIVELALLGFSNAEIAKRRQCAVRTVTNHIASIFQKLKIHCRSELAACVALAPEAPAGVSPCASATRHWDDFVAGRRRILQHVQSEDEVCWVLDDAVQPVARPLLRPIERRILVERGRGYSNKEIAYALGRSQATVSGIARRALRRLGLREVWGFSGLFTSAA